MAKNISKNQWFKDIADNVYLYTAAINNCLLIGIFNKSSTTIAFNTVMAKTRNMELFNFNLSTASTNLVIHPNGELRNRTEIKPNIFYIDAFPLKTKQLETDFYSPEQLAEMYPDDPAYQVATYELTDETKPVVDTVDNVEVT